MSPRHDYELEKGIRTSRGLDISVLGTGNFGRVNPGIPGHGSIPDLTTESLILFIISRTLVVVCY